MTPNVDSTGNNSLPIKNMNMGGEINIVNTGAKIENLNAKDTEKILATEAQNAAAKAANATAVGPDGKDTLNIQGKEKQSTGINWPLAPLLSMGPLGMLAYNYLNKPKEAPKETPPPNMTMTAGNDGTVVPSDPSIPNPAAPPTPKERLQTLKEHIRESLAKETNSVMARINNGEELTPEDTKLKNELEKEYKDIQLALYPEGDPGIVSAQMSAQAPGPPQSTDGQYYQGSTSTSTSNDNSQSDELLIQQFNSINGNFTATLARIQARDKNDATDKKIEQEFKKIV